MKAVVQYNNGFVVRLSLETAVLHRANRKNYPTQVAKNLEIIKEFGFIIANLKRLGVPVNTTQLKKLPTVLPHAFSKLKGAQ